MIKILHGRAPWENVPINRSRYRPRPDRTIDICLTCPEKVCKKGECERIRRKECSTEK